MKRCTATIVGLSPYSPSRSTQVTHPMLDRESHDDYERRIWQFKSTVNHDGDVCIPAMGWKMALDTVAYKLGVKVPNRRGATFKGFFVSGVICEADTVLHVNGHVLKPEDAECVVISANSDGVRGSGKRVPRFFPVFPKWETEVNFTITDDIISPETFVHHLRAAGIVVGVGRFRPEKGGPNGRYRLGDVKWEDYRL